MTTLAPLGSTVLDTGKTPGQWVALLAERGLFISERILRQRARRVGAFYSIGGAMILLPEHIDAIFMEGQPCRLRSIDGGESGGSGVGSSCTARQSPATTAKALAHLTKQARGTGLPPKQIGKGVVTSLETKRPSHSRMR